jgi:hypothetical protein
MTELTSAITSHNLDEISKLILADKSSLQIEVNGWLPLEWAKRTDNPFTYTRVLRLSDSKPNMPLLNKYLLFLSSTYWGPCDIKKSAERVWEQTFESIVSPFEKGAPDFELTIDQRKDLSYLINLLNIKSKDELVMLASNA